MCREPSHPWKRELPSLHLYQLPRRSGRQRLLVPVLVVPTETFNEIYFSEKNYFGMQRCYIFPSVLADVSAQTAHPTKIWQNITWSGFIRQPSWITCKKCWAGYVSIFIHGKKIEVVNDPSRIDLGEPCPMQCNHIYTKIYLEKCKCIHKHRYIYAYACVPYILQSIYNMIIYI